MVLSGYARTIEENLIDGIDDDWFKPEFEKGDGNELEQKIRAAYSSSALAVNNFARFKSDKKTLYLGSPWTFEDFSFEHKCPIGLRGHVPNLDLLARGEQIVVGVESKCTEYLASKPKHMPFAAAYERHFATREQTPWTRMMRSLIARPERYRFLHAAQLVKHAFGLGNCFGDLTVGLLYLYWEPTNADNMPEFAVHRREIDDFAAEVAGARVSFQSLSYRSLWQQWEILRQPNWLPEHLGLVRARYEIPI